MFSRWICVRSETMDRNAKQLNEKKITYATYKNKSITKKPVGVRMGKGKGNPEGWVARIKPGRVLFEISGCGETIAREALYLASTKISIRCKFLSRAIH